MIVEVEGDILLSEAQVIAHGMAASDPMNKGLALAIHEKYPMMHKDFHHWCHQHNPKPGTAWMWGGHGGVRIVNLITQEGGAAHGSHPSRAKLSYVSHALKDLRKMAEKEQFTSIALPRLATGVGGLDWNEVFPAIQQQLGDLDTQSTSIQLIEQAYKLAKRPSPKLTILCAELSESLHDRNRGALAERNC